MLMMNRFNEDFSKEVIQSLRGRRSMSWLSKRMGHQFNQVHFWESGKRVFYWKDFMDLCFCLKRPISLGMRNFFWSEEGESFNEVLKRGLAAYKRKEISDIFDISSSKLSRWLNDKTDIPFYEACNLLAFSQYHFYEFMDEVVGEGKLASIQRKVRANRVAKEALNKDSYIAAIAPALSLKEYRKLKKHKEGVLAQLIGITKEEEKRGISVLETLGQIYKKEGLYYLKSFHLNMVDDREAFVKHCQYWSDKASSFEKHVGMKSLFGYRVFGITEKSYKKLRNAQIQYYEEISKILKEQQGPYDHIALVNFQTLLLDE